MPYFCRLWSPTMLSTSLHFTSILSFLGSFLHYSVGCFIALSIFCIFGYHLYMLYTLFLSSMNIICHMFQHHVHHSILLAFCILPRASFIALWIAFLICYIPLLYRFLMLKLTLIKVILGGIMGRCSAFPVWLGFLSIEIVSTEKYIWFAIAK